MLVGCDTKETPFNSLFLGRGAHKYFGISIICASHFKTNILSVTPGTFFSSSGQLKGLAGVNEVCVNWLPGFFR